MHVGTYVAHGAGISVVRSRQCTFNEVVGTGTYGLRCWLKYVESKQSKSTSRGGQEQERRRW
jgi:hypothetical protein